ncbi:MAG: glycosyltransferase 87 family protein [Vicinamibacteria bacterium]|nr:glycosyltransferase 87 family protein [Vicinamibacteria bacterium]
MPGETRNRLPLPTLLWASVAFVAGLVVRLYFVSSHGSWDTEYWKAWASETANAGVTQAYGGPDAVPPGDFMPQLLAQKPRHRVLFRGRDFPIDYPPLGLAAWGASWRFFTSKPRPYRGAEAENLAVKFPAVLGDALAVGVLLWAFRSNPRAAATLAALYWIFPVTWVSSAILGFFDGFVPPFLLVSLLLVPASPALAGAAFAVTCLIKPTAAVALPVLYLGARRQDWVRITAGGALVTALVFLPYLVAGTFETAFIQIARLFSQDRLSGGYANPWWLLGHAVTVAAGKAEWSDPIDYVRRDSIALPLGLMGFVAAGLVALWILRQASRITTPRAAVYVSALLLFAWGVLTIGVHDNHNHPLFLLLVATGLGTPFLRGFAFAAATSTLLGSVCLHGLGRYYGPQWRTVLPIADSVARLRMAAGFDLTLLLGLVNWALLAVALWRLKPTLESLEKEP